MTSGENRFRAEDEDTTSDSVMRIMLELCRSVGISIGNGYSRHRGMVRSVLLRDVVTHHTYSNHVCRTPRGLCSLMLLSETACPSDAGVQRVTGSPLNMGLLNPIALASANLVEL